MSTTSRSTTSPPGIHKADDNSLPKSILRQLIPARQRMLLRQVGRQLKRRPREVASLIRCVSPGSIPDVFRCYEDFKTREGEYTEISLRGYPQPVRLRNGTSDFVVFRNVILDRQYYFPDLQDVEYIIDAGANIGLTSLYLLRKYPQARIIAIEPDPENFLIAAHNLEPFADRCELVHAGLWSHESQLTVSRGSFRDGRHWATRTEPAAAGDCQTVPAHSLQTLLKKFNFPRIDILKVDIEGAELQLFRDGDTSYLKDTRCCSVECHSDECEAAYRNALRPYGFALSSQSELLVARKS